MGVNEAHYIEFILVYNMIGRRQPPLSPYFYVTDNETDATIKRTPVKVHVSILRP